MKNREDDRNKKRLRQQARLDKPRVRIAKTFHSLATQLTAAERNGSLSEEQREILVSACIPLAEKAASKPSQAAMILRFAIQKAHRVGIPFPLCKNSAATATAKLQQIYMSTPSGETIGKGLSVKQRKRPSTIRKSPDPEWLKHPVRNDPFFGP